MLDFTFINKQRITKDFILSNINQETIIAKYLNIPIQSKRLFRSPFRDDKHPTCSLYKSASGILYFHDFATNDYFNCFMIVMKLYNCTFYEALQIIAEDFCLCRYSQSRGDKIQIIPEIKKTEISIIQPEIQNFTKEDLDWWNTYGIDENILKKFNVYSVKSVFVNGLLQSITTSTNPIYGYYGGQEKNIDLWRLYFPKRKEYRFLSNWNAQKIQGYDQLPDNGKLLIITKSMKDCMTLYRLGLTAIAPNSETLFISDEMLEELKNRFNKILVLYDNDKAGKYNMNKIRKKHPELSYWFIPNKYEAKDVSDFYKKYGENKTMKFIKKKLRQWLN